MGVTAAEALERGVTDVLVSASGVSGLVAKGPDRFGPGVYPGIVLVGAKHPCVLVEVAALAEILVGGRSGGGAQGTLAVTVLSETSTSAPAGDGGTSNVLTACDAALDDYAGTHYGYRIDLVRAAELPPAREFSDSRILRRVGMTYRATVRPEE